MRTYSVFYDVNENSWNVIYKDDDNPDVWYLYQSKICNKDTAIEIAHALNLVKTV